MTKEEIQEYLDRVDELGERLTGEDRDTYAWLIYGYNACAKMLHDTEEELEDCKKKIEEAIKYNEDLCKIYDCGMELSNAQTNLVILKGTEVESDEHLQDNVN